MARLWIDCDDVISSASAEHIATAKYLKSADFVYKKRKDKYKMTLDKSKGVTVLWFSFVYWQKVSSFTVPARLHDMKYRHGEAGLQP